MTNKFDESKHPRDEDGKFTDGNGTKSLSAEEAKKKNFIMSESNTPSAKEAKEKHFGNLTSGQKNANISNRVFQIKKIDNNTYEIPLGVRIKFGSKDLEYSEPIMLTEVITISKPKDLRDQTRIANNYGGDRNWSKKAGNALIEISNKKKQVQIHYYDNPHAGQAGFKIKQEKRNQK